MAPRAKSSSGDFDQWVFEIDQHRRAHPGKTDTSIRRECVDHIIVVGERHLRHVLLSYMNYYNETRTHLSLGKDAPITRAVAKVGRIIPRSILGGLHHQYVRI